MLGIIILIGEDDETSLWQAGQPLQQSHRTTLFFFYSFFLYFFLFYFFTFKVKEGVLSCLIMPIYRPIYPTCGRSTSY